MTVLLQSQGAVGIILQRTLLLKKCLTALCDAKNGYCTTKVKLFLKYILKYFQSNKILIYYIIKEILYICKEKYNDFKS